MTYNVSWDDNDSSVLWLNFSGQLTWDEYIEAFDTVRKTVSTVSHHVDVILNAETNVPPGNAIPHFHRALKLLEELPNFGIIASVNTTAGPFAKTMIDLIIRFMNPKMAGRVPFVGSAAEALRVIGMQRAKLAS